MPRRVGRVIAILFVLSCSFAAAQPARHPAQPKPPQTARQALLEIITGGGKAMQKHLTLEIQQLVLETAKGKDAPGKSGAEMSRMLTELMAIPSLAGEKDLQTFDSGPVLFSFSPREKLKIEVRVDSDDLSGDLDTMQLSIHSLKDGQEQSIPFMPNVIVGLKQQEKIWRLNEVGGNARLVVGDPRFFTDLLKFQQQDEQEAQQRKVSAEAPEKPERPKIPASSVVSIMAYAEARYAQENPETGFTCDIAELANPKDGSSGMLDPQIGTGSYSGYHFTITGCDTKPAISFRIVAEPLSAEAGAQAYCTDPTHNIRVSDDGRGGTCLSSGRVTRTEARFPD